MDAPRESRLTEALKFGRTIAVLLVFGAAAWGLVGHQRYLNRVGRPDWRQLAADIDGIIASFDGERSEETRVAKGQATVLIVEGAFRRPAGPIAVADMDRGMARRGWAPAKRMRADNRRYCKDDLVARLWQRSGSEAAYYVTVEWGSADVMCE